MIKTLVFIIIAALVLGFLFSFLKVRITYDGELSVFVSLLFIKLDVLKLVKKFQKKAKKKPKKKKKSEDEALGFLDKLSVGFAVAKEAVSGITKTIILEDVSVDIDFGSADAKSTAMTTGYIYSAVYVIEPFIWSNFKTENMRIDVRPEFDTQTFDVRARVCIKARLISLIIFGINLFMSYNRIKNQKKGAKPKSRLDPVT
ncbi:MAG: DUF2953 domain-containing protein [Clostridia bacterium]|nr:DUF2953 domain-containing protein [Clostridia bacterium]